jgi:MarR family transcriptional regulator, transcriptional regulator for hemolysin
MQTDGSELKVLATPGHLVSLAARGFARLSEARLKPLGFGLGYLPVLVALKNGRAETQRDLARFARIEQPSMARMLVRMERDGLIRRAPDPADGRSSLVSLTETAEARLPDACAVLFQGNREALDGFTDEEAAQLVSLLNRLIANLDCLASVDAARHER